MQAMCPACGAAAIDAAAIVSALENDDIDAALQGGLLQLCACRLNALPTEQRRLLQNARDQHTQAMRWRALHRATLARRGQPPLPDTAAPPTALPSPGLSSAAARALARAKAKAGTGAP